MVAGSTLVLSLLCLYGTAAIAEAGTSGSFKAPAFCGKYKCPEYKVAMNYETFELRVYEPAQWITTTVSKEKNSLEKLSSFRRLLEYMKGSNSENKMIEMTIPTVEYVPINNPSVNETMSFYLPATLTNPPQPTDPKLFLTRSNKKSLYVKSFGGFAIEHEYIKQAKLLEKELLQRGIPFVNSAIQRASYNYPSVRSNRHNEVWYLTKSN
uniref:Heme-binding protein 2 n=1 Tax=Leptobrachium leishanense TaxID=445787 RepID=A0A8C5MFR5_9ANUR